MTKFIELGLVLKGKGAKQFNEYIKNPEDTLEGKAMMKRAEQLAKQITL